MSKRTKIILSMATKEALLELDESTADSDNKSRASSELNEEQQQIVTKMEQLVGNNFKEVYEMANCSSSKCFEQSDNSIVNTETCYNKESGEYSYNHNILYDSDFSDIDPSYQPESSDSEESGNETSQVLKKPKLSENKENEIPNVIATSILDNILDTVWRKVKQPTRWKKSQPSEWKVNIAKKRRAEGSTYVVKNKIRPAKVPKFVDCGKCKYKCNEKLSNEARNKLCRNYWDLDYKAQKNFILHNIVVKPIQTRLIIRKSEKKERKFSKKCFFPQNHGERIQVCQKFFTATLCICSQVIMDAIEHSDNVGCYSKDDNRGRKEPVNKTSIDEVNFVKEHIESFPVMESHYTRKDTKRQYLDSTLSITKMYQLYMEKCNEYNRQPISLYKYKTIFGENYNLSFFTPKKDQCLVCRKYAAADPETRTKLQASYEDHRSRNDLCQKAKQADKEKASEDPTFMSITLDLQAVLQIPKGAVGQLYYLRKLVVYNLTIYEALLPNNAYCLCWSEINGKKGSCEIGTCLYYYLSNYLSPEISHLTIFSDTCGGQNRNQFIAILLLWAVQYIDHLQVIEQKFLESGHTYMEVDSMHSAIEASSKNRDIVSMNEWKNIFRNARRRKTKKTANKKCVVEPYQVREIKYDDVLDLKLLADQCMLNRTKDSDGNVVQWLKIKRIRYVKGEKETIFFNYDLSENFKSLKICGIAAPAVKRTRSKKRVNPPKNRELPETLPKLYKNTLPISEAKKKDLLKICTSGIFPDELHGWVNSLNTNKEVVDRVPDVATDEQSEGEDL